MLLPTSRTTLACSSLRSCNSSTETLVLCTLPFSPPFFVRESRTLSLFVWRIRSSYTLCCCAPVQISPLKPVNPVVRQIIARTAEIIGEKIRIQEEILTATASRRMEQKIMSAIPILIVVYIELTSPGFFENLYSTMGGRILMTICLGIYLVSCQLAKSFLEIEI